MENYNNDAIEFAGEKKNEPVYNGNEDRDSAFAKLIQGEYKEQFKNRFNREFGRRFKDMKQTEEELKTLKEALVPLMERFGEKDAVSLVKRILKGLEERDKNKVTEAEYVKKQYAEWKKEEKEMKEIYPEFDLQKELENPKFCAGLKSGIPMASLYKGLHFDELSKGISDVAAKAAVDNIRIGNGRIREAGNENSVSVKTKKRVEDLTDSEIKEILERVRLGEKISFGA